MADRALPDLRARLLLDTTDLSRAQARTREFSRDLSGSLRPGEQSLASLKQHFNELPAATGAAQAGISRLGSALGGVRSGLSAVGESVRQVGVVTGTAFAAAGTAAVAFAGHATMVALRATEMDIALQALAKANHVSATALEANVTAIRHQGIEIGVAQNLVAEFVQGNLDLTKAQNLARVAQDAAVISGRNSTETLALLVQGIRTQQIDVLRSAGVTISAANAYKQYAQAHHIAESAITETQKQQILLDEVLKQGISIQGAYAAALETPSKQLRSIPRLLNDIELNIGQAFEPALGKVITAGYKLAIVFRDATEKGQPLRALFDRAGESLTRLLAPLDRLVPKVKEFLGALTTEKVDHFLARLSEFAPVAAGVGAAISAMALRSIPVIGPFLAVLDPVVAGLGALVATQPDLRNLAGALGGLASTGFSLFQTVAAPAVDALSNAVGPRLIPFIRTLTGVLNEVTTDIQGGVPWWTTLAGALSVAGLKTSDVSAVVGFLHTTFDKIGPVIHGVVGFFGDLWDKANKVAEVVGVMATVAWPQLQTAFSNIGSSFGTVAGGFANVGGAAGTAAGQIDSLTEGTDKARGGFARFMTSGPVLDTLTFFAVTLPTAINVATTWLKVIATSFDIMLNQIAVIVRVAGDIIKGDWGKAMSDMNAYFETNKSLTLQGATDLKTALTTTWNAMDGDLEARQLSFKETMIGLASQTAAGTHEQSVQLKHDQLQTMRELHQELVGGSIIPDMVNDILRWFARMKDVGVGEMYHMAVGVTNWAATLATNVRSNVSAGFSGALQVIHDFAVRINSVLGSFGVNIPVPEVSPFAQGPSGVHSMATGGVIGSRQVGAGFVTSGPVLVGEGRGREFVIPEDPTFRGNALSLLGQAARALGVVGMQAGGILDWLPSAGAMVQGPTGSFTHAAILAATGGRAWDYMAAMGSPLYAGVPGTVLPGPGGGYGTSISFNMDAGGSVILGHLMSILAAGHVAKGTLIGKTDNTGFSTGPHLHFEVRNSAMAPGPGGGIDIHALIRAALTPLAAAAHGLANAIPQSWARALTNSIIDKVAANVAGRADGGPVVPGRVYRVGERGPELFSPQVAGQISPTGSPTTSRVEGLLGEAVSLLAQINGTPQLSRRDASRRYAT